MLAQLRLTVCGWECSQERIKMPYYGAYEIRLTARKKIAECGREIMSTNNFLIRNGSVDLRELEVGWETIREKVVMELHGLNPDRDFIPDEDSNREFLTMLGFRLETNRIYDDWVFVAARGNKPTQLRIEGAEIAAAKAHYGSMALVENACWGILIDRLEVDKKAKELSIGIDSI